MYVCLLAVFESVKSVCVCVWAVDLRRRLPGRDHERVDGVPTAGGLLPCAADLAGHAAGRGGGPPGEEPARVCCEGHTHTYTHTEAHTH